MIIQRDQAFGVVFNLRTPVAGGEATGTGIFVFKDDQEIYLVTAIDTVIGLPANLFYSTGIPVCILVLKKCKKPDNVLFINASGPENFEKGKRQNRLTEAHIAKIIDTYQFRKEEERYSKRVSMERIAEEGYNLNISRYISTAEAEIEIDLQATHRELKLLAEKIGSAMNNHNDFLEELGLPRLP